LSPVQVYVYGAVPPVTVAAHVTNWLSAAVVGDTLQDTSADESGCVTVTVALAVAFDDPTVQLTE
jgi:hypothetical protein